MRTLLLMLLLGMAALSGCLDDDAPDDDSMDDTMMDTDGDGFSDADEMEHGSDPVDAESVPTPPADIVFTGSLIGEGDASSNAPCALGDQQCVDHSVTVPEGDWKVTFTLVGTDGTVTSQGVPYATDYDLFVDGVGESTNPSGEADVVSARLAPGTYTAQVMAWHDIDGSYTLTVSFAFA